MERSSAIPQSLEGKQILITGGGGYLACGLIALLKDSDCRITRLVRSIPHDEVPGDTPHVKSLTGDVRDPDIWEAVLDGVDVVFHFAAQTSTYVANADPFADHAVNVMPILRLLEFCRRRKASITICFASTATVVGAPVKWPVDESFPDHPLTAYDLHKQMAEQYLKWYAEQGWVHGVTLRLPNIYGPGPRSSRGDRGILNQMIRRALDGYPLTVYGAGDQLRDYLYIEDAARAFLVAAAHSEALSGQHFFVGSDVGYSIASALKMVADRAAIRTGKVVEVRRVPPPVASSPVEQRNFVADSRRFREATGWQSSFSLQEGIDQTMEDLS
jgi:nucleoside-diphosphate-sugar epimerase